MTLSTPGAAGAHKRLAALSAVAGLAIIPLLLAGWLVDTALQQLASNQELSRMLAALEERLDAPGAGVPAAQEEERSLLKGETAGVAGAALQSEVAAIVESVEANTVEMELLDRQEEADPGKVSLRITFEAQNDALQRILLAVEGNTTALYLRSLAIEAMGEATGQAAGEAGGDAGASEPTLRATAVIEGFWREARP